MAWLPGILVESSTGTRPSVTGLLDVTRMSAVRLVTTRELTLDFSRLCVILHWLFLLASPISYRRTRGGVYPSHYHKDVDAYDD